MAEDGLDKKRRLRRRRGKRRTKPEPLGDSPERRAERAEERHGADAAKEPNRWELPPYGMGG